MHYWRVFNDITRIQCQVSYHYKTLSRYNPVLLQPQKGKASKNPLFCQDRSDVISLSWLRIRTSTAFIKVEMTSQLLELHSTLSFGCCKKTKVSGNTQLFRSLCYYYSVNNFFKVQLIAFSKVSCIGGIDRAKNIEMNKTNG